MLGCTSVQQCVRNETQELTLVFRSGRTDLSWEKYQRKRQDSKFIHTICLVDLKMMDGKCLIWSNLSYLSICDNVDSCSMDERSTHLCSPLLRFSPELWTVSTLLCRQRVTVKRQGPPSQWGKGSAGDVFPMAAVWPTGHRDDCYQSWKVGYNIIHISSHHCLFLDFFFFFLHFSLVSLTTWYFSFLHLHKLQEDVSNIPGANFWDVSCCWIRPAHGLCPCWW